jgi:hypothetical protein
MQGVKDASGLYEVERRDCYAARPGFRIVELQISPTQKVPWHYHNKVRDTFYVIEGSIRIFLQDPKEKVELTPGQFFAVAPACVIPPAVDLLRGKIVHVHHCPPPALDVALSGDTRFGSPMRLHSPHRSPHRPSSRSPRSIARPARGS